MASKHRPFRVRPLQVLRTKEIEPHRRDALERQLLTARRSDDGEFADHLSTYPSSRWSVWLTLIAAVASTTTLLVVLFR